MLKKLLKIIGSFLLVLSIILACLGAWFWISVQKYNETALPYINETLPKVLTWDYDKFKVFLSPDAKTAFETPKGQQVIKYFSKLGALKSFDEPNFINSNKGINVNNGNYEFIIYSILGHFEKGDATIALTLSYKDNKYSIQYININSDVFIQ